MTRVGKTFERQLMDAFKRAEPRAWVHRNTDAMTGKGVSSVPSAPDILVVAPGFNLLCEAKAVKGPSIAFSRLAPHQRDHLVRFDTTQSESYGVVGVLSYNGERGRLRRYDAWLVPVCEWVELEGTGTRKSLPLAGEARTYLARWHMPWLSGTGFDAAPALAALGCIHPHE